jgi:hypothetical protein
MVKRISSEADNYSAGQDIPRHFTEAKSSLQKFKETTLKPTAMQSIPLRPISDYTPMHDQTS